MHTILMTKARISMYKQTESIKIFMTRLTDAL